MRISRNYWPWLIGAALMLALIWLLRPILMPFVVSLGLAYVGNPLVNRMQRWHISRTLAVCIVFAAITIFTVVSLVLLIPPLEQQISTLIDSLPDALRWVQNTALPKLGISLPQGVRLDVEGLRKLITDHWGSAGDLAVAVWQKVSASGLVLFTTVVNLALIPVVSFYLLRDWNDLVHALHQMTPPRHRPRINALAAEVDDVLGAFLRGQLLVMLALGLIYGLGLTLIGLKLALVIGVVAGLLSFVPYLGFATGFAAALIAMLVQTGEPLALLWVALVFVVGQIAEGSFLTPNLVGHRIGLHPVTVIFAVMAGGVLFGFIGVLLALPSAAVIAVLVRHARAHWLQSRAYLGPSATTTTPFDPGPE